MAYHRQKKLEEKKRLKRKKKREKEKRDRELREQEMEMSRHLAALKSSDEETSPRKASPRTRDFRITDGFKGGKGSIDKNYKAPYNTQTANFKRSSRKKSRSRANSSRKKSLGRKMSGRKASSRKKSRRIQSDSKANSKPLSKSPRRPPPKSGFGKTQNRSRSARRRIRKLRLLLLGKRKIATLGFNVLLGDRQNEISQKYSGEDFVFKKGEILILKRLTFGFDESYLTGVQMDYLAFSDSWGVREYLKGEDGVLERVNVKDAADIRSQFFIILLDTSFIYNILYIINFFKYYFC